MYKGTYKGYGRVDSCPVENLYDTNQYLPFAISKEAWEFGIELSKSLEYKSTIDYIQNKIDLNFKIIELEKLTGGDEFDSIKQIIGSENLIGFGAEYKILACLDRFCWANHFNMFEQDIYCSQSINFDDMKTWEELRNVRIKHLKTKIEE